MKALVLFLASCSAVIALHAQPPLTQPEALGRIYRDYNPEKSTAQWECTAGQKKEGPHEGWPCAEENATVSVSVVMMAEVEEYGADMVYLVASAKPAGSPGGYECHACAPALGAAVFVAQEGNWALQSANPAVGFCGGCGYPPAVDFVEVGAQRRGFVLSMEDEGQGFSASFSVLVIPVGKTVSGVWSIHDEEDDLGAYDPTGKLNKLVQHRSSAAFKFVAGDSTGGNADRDFYDIEVISRGDNHDDWGQPTKTQDWTEVYRFKDGRYRLLSHKDFIETRKPAPKPKLQP